MKLYNKISKRFIRGNIYKIINQYVILISLNHFRLVPCYWALVPANSLKIGLLETRQY